jgi:hypothetical protein
VILSGKFAPGPQVGGFDNKAVPIVIAEAGAGELARMTMHLPPSPGEWTDDVVLTAIARIRSETDHGVDIIVQGLPTIAHTHTNQTVDVKVTDMMLNLYGEVGVSELPFMRNPTSCVPAFFSLAGTSSLDGNTTSASAPRGHSDLAPRPPATGGLHPVRARLPA